MRGWEKFEKMRRGWRPARKRGISKRPQPTLFDKGLAEFVRADELLDENEG